MTGTCYFLKTCPENPREKGLHDEQSQVHSRFAQSLTLVAAGMAMEVGATVLASRDD